MKQKTKSPFGMDKKTAKKKRSNLILLLFLLLALLLRHARKPIQTNGCEHVENNESPQNAKVAPALRVAAVDLAQEDIRAGIRAKTALIHVLLSTRLELTEATVLVVFRQVRLASLARGRGEVEEFVLGAGDGVAREADAEHAVDEVGEGREAVHEDPEVGELAGRGDDAAEDEAEGEHQVGDVAAGFGVGDAGDDHVCESGGEEEELQREEEEEGAALVGGAGGGGVVLQADGVVEADEDDDGHESVPGEFDGDVGDHESLPGVGSAGSLTDLVKRALCDEMRHDLLHELTKDSEQQED